MSVQTEIARIAQAKTDIKNVVNSKVANTITNQTIDAFPPLIDGSIAAYKNLIPWIEGSGSSFTIDNAEAGKLDKFEMYGNTHQDSYTGKNLLNKDLFVQGSYNYGNAGTIPYYNSSATNRFTLAPSNAIEVKPNTKYTFNMNYTNDVAIAQLESSGTTLGDTGWKTISTLPFTITTSATTKYISFNFKKDDNTTIDTIKNYDYQLEEGNSATSYEPYVGGTPSPNPDYPQDVKVVTGEQDIEISGKNLAKSKTVYSTTNNYAKVLYVDFDIKPNTTYTFSFNGTSGNTVYFNENIFTTANYVTISNNRVESTVTTKSTILSSQYEDGKGWAILKNAAGNTNANVFDDLQVEYGSTATPYEPYQSQTYPINLGVENLSQLENISTTADGYITKSNSAIGTLKANTTYTLSMNCSTEYTSTTKNLSIRNYYMPGQTTNEVLFDLTYKSGQRISCTFTPNYDGELSINAYLGASYTNVFTNIELVKGSTAQYVSDTPIELCKIGNYQDRIYKDNGKWYKHSEIGKVVLDGSENWIFSGSATTPTNRSVIQLFNRINPLNDNYLSNYFIKGSTTPNRIVIGTTIFVSLDDTITGVVSGDTNEQKTAKLKSWLVSNNTIVYYILATPTNEEITDTTLIGQLNAIETYTGTNTFSVSNSNGVLPDLYVLTEKQNSYKN